MSKMSKLHKGRLDCVSVVGSTIFTGGTDCKVNVLDKSLSVT